MNRRRIVFAYLDDLAVDIWPADMETNALYRAAVMTHLRPYALAASMGRISDERSQQILAKVYAEGVVAGSPTDELVKYHPGDWERWLLDHQEEFAKLREFADDLTIFEEPHGHPAHSAAAS